MFSSHEWNIYLNRQSQYMTSVSLYHTFIFIFLITFLIFELSSNKTLLLIEDSFDTCVYVSISRWFTENGKQDLSDHLAQQSYLLIQNTSIAYCKTEDKIPNIASISPVSSPHHPLITTTFQIWKFFSIAWNDVWITKYNTNKISDRIASAFHGARIFILWIFKQAKIYQS